MRLLLLLLLALPSTVAVDVVSTGQNVVVPYDLGLVVLHGNVTYSVAVNGSLEDALVGWKAANNVSDGAIVNFVYGGNNRFVLFHNSTAVSYFATSDGAKNAEQDSRIGVLEKSLLVSVIIFILMVFLWTRDREVS